MEYLNSYDNFESINEEYSILDIKIVTRIINELRTNFVFQDLDSEDLGWRNTYRYRLRKIKQVFSKDDPYGEEEIGGPPKIFNIYMIAWKKKIKIDLYVNDMKMKVPYAQKLFLLSMFKNPEKRRERERKRRLAQRKRDDKAEKRIDERERKRREIEQKKQAIIDLRNKKETLKNDLFESDHLNEQFFTLISAGICLIFITIFFSRGIITKKLFTMFLKKAKNADIQVRLINNFRGLPNIIEATDVEFYLMDYRKKDSERDYGPFYYININMDDENNPHDPLGEEQWEEPIELIISTNTKRMLIKNIPLNLYPKMSIGKRVVKLKNSEYDKIIEKITPLLQQ